MAAHVHRTHALPTEPRRPSAYNVFMKNNLKPYREKHGVSNKEAMKAVCLSSSPFIAPSQRYALNSALAHAISSPRRSPHSGATRLKTRVAAKSPRRGRRRPRRKRPRHRSKARRPRRARRSPRATLDGLVFTVVTQRQSGHSNPSLLSCRSWEKGDARAYTHSPVSPRLHCTV